ncbi:MAG: hypothetical protein RL090_560 [Bacteroidota bacterium]|jgi:hypothetical protein
MMTFLKNFLAVVVGLVIGGLLNKLILKINGSLIPLPAGVDVSTEAGLVNTIKLFNPINFLAPFLAHAIGTFVAVWVTTKLAVTKSWNIARIPGILFFIAGAYMVYLLQAPLWFETIDLVFAFLPMAWLGFLLARPNKKTNQG